MKFHDEKCKREGSYATKTFYQTRRLQTDRQTDNSYLATRLLTESVDGKVTTQSPRGR